MNIPERAADCKAFLPCKSYSSSYSSSDVRTADDEYEYDDEDDSP